jgi:TRAP-type C4-dicarboxylate transport system permease small subunit
MGKQSFAKKAGRAYDAICRLEMGICMACFMLIIVLVFGNAILRKLGIPLQWASDVAQLLFSYLAFLGADIALRKGSLVGVGLLTERFPAKARTALSLVCYLLMASFLLVIIWHGFPLAVRSWKRSFQSLSISYSWVTLSLPVSATLMLLSIIHNIIADFHVQATKEA